MDTQDFADLLAAYGRGDRDAFDQIVLLVYDELRRLASHIRRKEGAGQTLQTTALVHEAFMRLAESERVSCIDRTHFMALAARTMRRVLVDHARGHLCQKRGGGAIKTELDEAMAMGDEEITSLIAIDEMLDGLADFNARAAQVFELRYFGGFANKEIAEVMKVTEGRAAQYYGFAKTWLNRELSRQQEGSHAG